MKSIIVILLGALLLIGACAPKEEAAKVDAKDMVSLEKDIMPVISGKCGACHRRETVYPKAVANGIFYETEADILGQVGKDILPGKPDESRLYGVLTQAYAVGESQIFMPHAGTGIEKWSEEELAKFKKWVAQGAKDN
jgi:hypothetical protein